MVRRLVIYDPITERVAWEKELTPEDVAALIPVIGATGGPDQLIGCWSLEAYVEDFADG